MGLKKHASMDITVFETDGDSDFGPQLIHSRSHMVKEITEFYKKKFQDKGTKNQWVSKKKAREALEKVTLDEFLAAVLQIKVKAVT